MGLRHNFEASEDGANFYSAEQIQALNAEVGVSGYAQQNQAHANSVMEYIDDLKALKHLGAYDIEALERRSQSRMPTPRCWSYHG
ncbi:MAG: hypothetical protein IPK04_01010 [Bdellovibrionales bacterium]|nr:hypothetical protein [Bdellovibrionales bacterium]